MTSEIRRIEGTTSAVPPAELVTFHRNPRVGDIDKIAGSLIANGQYKPIVANIGTHTGRMNEVLAGNHTLLAFRQVAEQKPFEKQWNRILVHWVDVDEDMANRIVLVDNRSFDAGEGTDDATVYALLSQVGTTGTGYTDADLDALSAAFDKTAEIPEEPDPDEEPAKPNLNHRESAISYTIVFDDETQQEGWFEFVKLLAERYPTAETLADRLIAHLEDTAGERV